MRKVAGLRASVGAAVLCTLLGVASTLFASNQILGEIKLVPAGEVERTSGVWVDGQYLGYVGELKGSKKVLLLPGEHEIVIRQDGYKDFVQRLTTGPAYKYTIQVVMQRDPQAQYPKNSAMVKLSVLPKRAAVFVDGAYVGHVEEFMGLGHGMLVAPGKHHIEISLPGFQTFRTDINLLAGQKFELKTVLFLS